MARHRYQKLRNKKPKRKIKPKFERLSLSSITLSDVSRSDEKKVDSKIGSDTEYNLSEIGVTSNVKPSSTESKEDPKSILKKKLDTENKGNESSVSSENMILELLKRLKSYCWSSNTSEPQPEKHIMLPKNQKKKETGKERFESDNLNTNKENGVKAIGPRPEKHTSKSEKILEKKQDDANPKLPCQQCESEVRMAKARQIIKTALKYGISNGLVRKDGKQYVLFSRRKLKRMIKKNKPQSVPSQTDDVEILEMVNKLSEEDVQFLYTRPAQSEGSTSQLTDNKSCDSITTKKSNNSGTASKHNQTKAREHGAGIPPARTKSAPHKLHYSCCEHPSTRKSNISMKRKRKLSKNTSSNCEDSSHSCSKKSKKCV